MIPQDTVERILDAAKVEEVIGDYVTLRRQGANYLACCPFHNEKTPSFSVSPSKGFYYCFGCHKGGSSVTFLMEHENMSYVDALRHLARKYNIEIVEEEESEEDIQAKERKESLRLVSSFAQDFFARNLESGEGRAVGYAYFKKRGLEDGTIRKFGLGWCPSDSKALYNAARAAGYKEEYLVATGLCVKTDDGHFYDRFKERVMFPFHDISGRVIGFNGRKLREEQHGGKYVNSPETEIYVKNRFLYGMWFAKQTIAKLDKCILVEGNLDMISMHQLGLTNVVASCGTSLTTGQIRLIKRFTNNVTIIYDGDSAGIKAARRGADMFLAEGLDVKVVILPDGQDPDDFCRSNTLEEVTEYIASHEKDFISFRVDDILEDTVDDPLGRANLINEVADSIAWIPDPVKRAAFTDFCATRFDMEKSRIGARVNASRRRYDEEEAKRRERERSGEAEDGQVPAETESVPFEVPGAYGIKIVEKKSILEPAERALLKFILEYGCKRMLYSSDSPYYTEEPMTVAEFIDSALADVDVVFDDPVCRDVYDAYFELYDKGYSQEDIIRRMVAGDKENVVKFTAELTANRYEVTKKNLKESMTNTSTWLINEVPRAILTYHVALLDKEIAGCRERMAGASDQMPFIKEIARLTQDRNKLKKALGRI